ncbi:stalk domain-containing protein [Paenibacillus thalictri]|uniref:Copper amine oxidase-like N-terminal domain-containing protein n=1 Tax=Paenibacillus thalictri TaxID=2527873 RepID=A0A4Q9DX55_9BACL|nr:stalk domain-containing protein [Paenibacillus thalictri]TBL80347.1 hypothetical protein EYB31_07990 [Paenibacillus thalictri]
MKWSSKTAAAAIMGVWMATVSVQPAAAVSVTSTYIQLFPNLENANVNGVKQPIDVPVEGTGENTFVPLHWLGERLGQPVVWNEKTKKAQMITPKAYIEFDLAAQQVTVNGQAADFGQKVKLSGDRLMVKVSWLAAYAGFTTSYNAAEQRTDVVYVPSPSTGYNETGYGQDDMPNSKPVAKFMLGKESYRMGEPVDYIDLSYDPDAEGLPGYEWTGKQDVFFKPGEYKVSLKVKDPKGNVSDEYSRLIQVKNEMYWNRFDYGLRYDPIGTLLKPDWGQNDADLLRLPQLPSATKDASGSGMIGNPGRKLISADLSAAQHKGIISSASINGKARISVRFINNLSESAQLAVVMRKTGGDTPATIVTTRKGETAPTIYTQDIDSRAAAQFMLNHSDGSKLEVTAEQPKLYKVTSEMRPGQGITAHYDIQTDDDVTVYFIVMAPGESEKDLSKYTATASGMKSLPALSSGLSWEADATGRKEAGRLTFGEQPVGVQSGQLTAKPAVLGESYSVRIIRPRKAALLMYPRGGYFHGPIKINDTVVMVPEKGGLTTMDGADLLLRTNGTEPWIDLEWMPSDGTQLPVDFVLYPLEEKTE